MKVEDLKRQYPNEWLVIAVERKNRLGIPIEGQLLAHGHDTEAMWREVAARQGEFYVLYTGEILKDTAVIFGA